MTLEWLDPATGAAVACGHVRPSESNVLGHVLRLTLQDRGEQDSFACLAWPNSVRALIQRIRKRFPVADGHLTIDLLTDIDLGRAVAGRRLPILPPGADGWDWLNRTVLEMARLLGSGRYLGDGPSAQGKTAMRLLACVLLGVPVNLSGTAVASRHKTGAYQLRVTFDTVQMLVDFSWTHRSDQALNAKGRVRSLGGAQLNWELQTNGKTEVSITSPRRNPIHAALLEWQNRFPCDEAALITCWVRQWPGEKEPRVEEQPCFGEQELPFPYIEDNIVEMAKDHQAQSISQASLGLAPELEPLDDFAQFDRRFLRKEQKRLEEEARLRERMAQMAEKRREREQLAAERRRAVEAARSRTAPSAGSGRAPIAGSNTSSPAPPERAPVPKVNVRLVFPALEFQDTAFPLSELKGYSLRERAALWWVSNQSDDLLCLPNCRITRLDYQVRAALRVLGPLRGRALLSDEVGLGKTVEAGLVIKELLTRGMVKRFLVLTVPSLVDQWEEELAEKFGLVTATTNHASARAEGEAFWRDNPAIVASLHTLKQPAQRQIAAQVHWDILVVDEAHYLRNRESQAWQAVNALPRQFLLLLTATPVQNSLEELYNLVTLLQPGQLPTPKEFRARFFDPKRPRQPLEPEELRRLLGQVMIRNTRANCGVELPPRRAETVLFSPDEAERTFWQGWETELREQLGRLNPAQASLWGRLLLQSAGSSPAAWRSCLERFPDPAASSAWRQRAPLEPSWARKCELIPPLTRGEGGVVIFSQFLETQAALANFLESHGVDTFWINGSTPAAERQPITEQFRKRGGALLLTHSGTEGRNLQFCHRLVNFDLPWNPMEIEQRIGRLHRLGQQHPVRIYNFVQAGTLQAHLLEILQEKLNLFELVVGETGLVLGDRFGSDEFAEEILRRWRESEGRVAEALSGLGEELADARDQYSEVKKLDETLFAKDYESL